MNLEKGETSIFIAQGDVSNREKARLKFQSNAR